MNISINVSKLTNGYLMDAYGYPTGGSRPLAFPVTERTFFGSEDEMRAALPDAFDRAMEMARKAQEESDANRDNVAGA